MCIRIDPSQKMMLERHAADGGINLSELMRTMIVSYLSGQPVGSTDGYQHARSLAGHLAQHALVQAIAALPSTYEDALVELDSGDQQPE
jgi:hypothetical protein